MASKTDLNDKTVHKESEETSLKESEITNEDNGIVFSEMIPVFVGGFPCNTSYEKAVEYLLPVQQKYISTSMKQFDQNFKGFVFVRFKTYKEAEDFNVKKFRFNNKVQTTRIAIDHDGFINECLSELRYPIKVFFGNVPRKFTDKTIAKYLNQYGKIKEATIVQRNKNNFAYVKFERTEDCQNLVNKKHVYLSEFTKSNVGYGLPNFTKEMQKKIHPAFISYIKMIKQDRNYYDPIRFGKLADTIAKITERKYLQPGEQEILPNEFFMDYGSIENLYLINSSNYYIPGYTNNQSNEPDVTPYQHAYGYYPYEYNYDQTRNYEGIDYQMPYENYENQYLYHNHQYYKNNYQNDKTYYCYDNDYTKDSEMLQIENTNCNALKENQNSINFHSIDKMYRQNMYDQSYEYKYANCYNHPYDYNATGYYGYGNEIDNQRNQSNQHKEEYYQNTQINQSLPQGNSYWDCGFYNPHDQQNYDSNYGTYLPKKVELSDYYHDQKNKISNIADLENRQAEIIKETFDFENQKAFDINDLKDTNASENTNQETKIEGNFMVDQTRQAQHRNFNDYQLACTTLDMQQQKNQNAKF